MNKLGDRAIIESNQLFCKDIQLFSICFKERHFSSTKYIQR